MPRFEKILVPIDFSQPSARALEVAIDMAKTFGAALDVVHVEQPFVAPASVPHMLPLSGLDGVAAAVRAACEKQLTDAAARARSAGIVRVGTKLLEGSAWHAIVELAKRDSYDLIVIGTHGRSGIERVLLGSVTERVVRKAPCTVLTVHDDPAAREAAAQHAPAP